MTELTHRSAIDVRAALLVGDITPLDCLDALEQRIAAVNAPVNAMVTLCFERARDHARQLMTRPLTERGILGGLPIAIKDLSEVKSVRSTQGSLIFADHIGQQSNLVVSHLENEGGVVYGMTNTPEFGAGAQTFNAVFGATRNPWDTRLTPAGSSGGAAVALATGMAWLAHGSDLGGSLRNPASFCGVVGLRPSPGRVAATPRAKIDNTLGVEGPMARNVRDCALLFDAMTGAEPGDPLSLPRDGKSYLAAAQRGWKPKRVAVSANLGITPVDPEIADIVMAAAKELSADGVVVEEAHPDLREAMDCFQTLRAMGFATGLRQLLAQHRDKLKPDVIWNIEKGLALTGVDIALAEAQRATLFRRMAAFLSDYDLLLCPATIVPPFPVEVPYPRSCNGVAFETYIDWLLIVAVATLCACPAMSLPCGFTSAGLPVGLQVIAPNRGEEKLFAATSYFESVFGLSHITPIDPRVHA